MFTNQESNSYLQEGRMANQNTNMPDCNWKKKLQINIQTEMHQIYKEVPKKSLSLKKNSLLLKAHNIITDLKIDLKVFFFFQGFTKCIHKLWEQNQTPLMLTNNMDLI